MPAATSTMDDIRSKVRSGGRLTREEGLELLQRADLLELGALAQEVRFRHNPERVVTFVIDTNLNYSNVCDAHCAFCAFYRPLGHAEAYTYTPEEVVEKIGRAAAEGVNTVLLQGGLHPELPLEYYEELVRLTCQRYPQVLPHFFSAPEVLKMSEVSGLSVREVLARLWAAGLRTLPGGGSEILSDRVKRKVSRLYPKNRSEDWLAVHREAHRLGYRTTATMLYGHLEEDEDIVEHLEVVRALQDETGGFTAFIPWSYKREHTALAQEGEGGGGPQPLPAHHCPLAALPGQRAPHPGVVVLGGEEDGAGGPALRGGRLRRHAVRGERDAGRRLLQPHHGGRGDDPHPGGRLPARPAHHAVRDRPAVLVRGAPRGRPRTGRGEPCPYVPRGAPPCTR